MDRRAHYLEIALSLFAAHGFNGVSVDRIVSEAGGSKATLYRYFSSKEAIFDAIIVELTAETIEEQPIEDLLALPLEDGLRLIGHATAEAALSERATVLFRMAAGEATRFPQLAEAMFERGPGRAYERLRQYIEARTAAGETHTSDVQVAAEQFLGGIVGHQQLRVALGHPPPSDSAVAARVEAAVRAFKMTYPPRDA